MHCGWKTGSPSREKQGIEENQKVREFNSLNYDIFLLEKRAKKYPYNYIAGADYFFLPSRWEGLPNCVLESLALGVPVVSTSDSGGLVELLRKGYKSIYIYENFDDLKGFFSKYMPVRTGGLKQSLLGKEFDQKEIYYLFEENINNLFIR